MIARLTTMRALSGLFAGVLLGLGLGLSPGVGSAQESGAALSADQIKQLIVGNTVSGALRANPYSIYYQADGKVSAIFHTNDDDGSWKIKDGNKLCQEYSDLFNGEEHCYQWYKAAGQRYLMRNVDTYKIDDLGVWKIEKGNPLGM